MANFPLPVKASISDDFKMPARIVQFGDRYTERSPDGLSLPVEVWSVEVAFANEAVGANLQAFLVEHGQWKPFKWQSPRDSSPQDYCIKGAVGGSFRRGGGGKPVFFTRMMKFERVWDAFALPPVVVPPPFVPPVVPPSAPIVSVAANGVSGWMVSYTGATTSTVVVNYSLSVTPSGGGAMIVNGTIAIPSGSSSGFVAISSATGDRSEVLTVGAGVGYAVGSPSSASIVIAAPSPSVSVVSNGSTGWTITRSIVAGTPLMVSYSLAVTPSGGAATTTTVSIQIAGNSGSVFVAIGSATNSRTELVTIVAGAGYTIGSPSSASITFVASVPSALLLHFDGANNSTITVDSSATPKAVSLVGGAIISTVQSKFGGSSLYLPGGANNYAIVADSNAIELGSSDFTIEFFVMLTAATTSRILNKGDGNNGATSTIIWNVGSALAFWGSGGGLSVPTPALPLNQWYHFAITRQGTSCKTFGDGAVISTQSINISLNNVIGGLTIGGSATSGITGYIDEFRLIIGTAAYTAAFIPPTSPFT